MPSVERRESVSLYACVLCTPREGRFRLSLSLALPRRQGEEEEEKIKASPLDFEHTQKKTMRAFKRQV